MVQDYVNLICDIFSSKCHCRFAYLVSLGKVWGHILQFQTQSCLDKCFSWCCLRKDSLLNPRLHWLHWYGKITSCFSWRCLLKSPTGINWLQWRQCFTLALVGAMCLIIWILKFWTLANLLGHTGHLNLKMKKDIIKVKNKK